MITVFSKDGCLYCDKAKALLDDYEIDYTVENVSTDPVALAFIKDSGHTTVPQIYNGLDLLVEGGYAGLSSISRETLLEIIE